MNLSQNIKQPVRRQLFIVIALALTSLFSMLCQNLHAQDIHEQLLQTAANMNKSLPMNVDADTRLDSVTILPGKAFQYNYTLVNYTASTIDAGKLKNLLEPNIIKTAKTSPGMKPFRDYEVTMTYNYNDKNGKFLLKIVVTPEEYK